MTDRTTTARLRADVADYIGPMDKAASKTDDVAVSAKQLAADISALEKQQKAAAKSIEDIAKAEAAAQKKRSDAMEKVSKGALAVGTGLVLAFGAAVASTAQFDKEMSAVGAAAQVSGKQLDSLRNAALAAGKDTAFSATEAAQAEEALAKAGVSTSDILSGALSGSLSLAAAGEMDLGEAAEDAASAMTTFHLKGKDVGHIADVLAAGAGKAQGEVRDMAFALNQSGLVASQLNISLDDTVGALAEFASNGLEGSDAGTSFKTMLLSLNPKTDEAATLMKNLGLDFFDAQGQFVGVAAMAGQLHDKLAPLTDEQKQLALSTIFGSDAIRAASLFMRDGADGAKQWEAAVNDQGFAAQVAGQKTDNLAGDIERLKGSLETALIQDGATATSALRALTQAADGAVGQFIELPKPLQVAGTAFAGIGGGILVALGGLGTMMPKVKEARQALIDLGPAGATANKALGMLGKASAVGIGVIGLAEAVHALGDAIDKEFQKGIPKVDDLSISIKRLATSGSLKDTTLDAKHLAGAISDLDIGTGTLDQLTRGLSDLGNGNLMAAADTFALNEAAKGSKKEIRDLDQTFAEMVQGGDVDAAQKAFGLLQRQLEDQGVSTDKVTKAFPQYAQALKGAKADADLASAGMKGTSESLDSVAASAQAGADAMSDERTEAQKLKDSFDQLNGINISATEGAIAYKDQVVSLKDSLKENGNTLDINTASGRANMTQYLDTAKAAQDYATAVVDQTGDQASANKILTDARNQLYNVAIQSGLTKEAARRLVDQYLSVPKSVNTNFGANTGAAQGAIDRLNNSLNKLHDRTVSVNVRTIYQNPGTAARPSSGLLGFAEGGYITGPGGPTSDSIPARVSTGEYIIQASTVAKYGRDFFDRLNAGMAPMFGRGGYVRHVEISRHTQTITPAPMTVPPQNITVNAATNADSFEIAREVAWQLRTAGV